MNEVTAEDIAAARAEGPGELVAVLLLAAGLPVSRTKAQAAKPEPEPDSLHIAHPGAWPTGTQRPAPVSPIPAQHVDAALADYRHWLVADRPAAPTRCPCPGCTPGGIT